ncbi:MAG TPA: hypothetical protein VGN34_32090 [Ktedonobacteraceae bacterium]|jgi:hypothetical protein
MVTITLYCAYCGSDALVRDGHAPTENRNVVVMLVGVAAARTQRPMPTQKLDVKRSCMRIKNAVVCAASRVHLSSLA